MFSLQGQAAIVTGAAQGIGFGIACELLHAGCDVVIADRNSAKAKEAANSISSSSVTAAAVQLDVTDETSVDACCRASLELFPHLGIIVNNAGIHSEKLGVTSTVEDFRRCFDVNLFGAWRVTQAFTEHLKKRGAGRIINIASINGRQPWADTPAYSASKAALLNLTQALALQLGPHNINVNAVCPGGVITAMADQFALDHAALRDSIIAARALKRDLLPKDIGMAAAFFASDMARNITGQALNVDGGAVWS